MTNCKWDRSLNRLTYDDVMRTTAGDEDGVDEGVVGLTTSWCLEADTVISCLRRHFAQPMATISTAT